MRGRTKICFSKYGVVLASILILFLLSGCVIQTPSLTFNFNLDKLNATEQLYVRYSDGSLETTDQSSQINQEQVIIPTDNNKKIVGFYVSDGSISWVPTYSYPGSTTINFEGASSQKPTYSADHVVQAGQPVAHINDTNYVDVKFAVYGTDGELVNGQTEVFAHSTNKNLSFYDTDPLGNHGNAMEGISSYTVDGYVTFVIQSDISSMSSTPLSLYSGTKLIYEKNVSSDASLTSLNLSGITLNPSVSGNVYAYTATVPNEVSVTEATYSTSDNNATAELQLNGASTNNPLPLSVGANVISIVVTAKDGTIQPYTVTVTRAGSNNAALTSLHLSGITLTPTVSENVYAYTASVPNEVSVTEATYSTSDNNATAELLFNGASTSNPIPLSVGSNVISVVVTAQDGTIQPYTVTVTRAGSNNAALTSINLSGITLNPSVSEGVYDYSATVPNDVSVTTATYTTSDSNATVAIQHNGIPVNNQIDLILGSNIISYVVTAQDGSTMNYTVNVIRAALFVTSITVSSSSSSMYVGDTLQFSSEVTPNNATDKTFSWSVIPGTGAATINADGLLTATYAGTITVQATANDEAQVVGSKAITIYTRSSGDDSTPDPAPAPLTAPPKDVFKSDVVKSDGNVVKNIESRVQEALKTSITVTLSDTKGHWAAKTIDTFVKLHVIEGYGDGSFNPDGNITRAEFAIILSRVFDIKAEGNTSAGMKDVANHWAKDAIKNLANAGVISGYEDGTFKPNNMITREEMVVLLSRLLNLDNVSKDVTKGKFNDLEGSYAAEEIKAEAQAGIISGEADGTFDAKNNATRAEALQIILNALKLNTQLQTLLNSLN
ncbi:S-layer homology domain-containing protein [Paenibacillus sp. LjRoot153]|uniref:S-layer homology domain-containing protein n=1 Tax=Paenibacillus sp. LjRoot153 TaxID=3342270 RepID=UPI003ECFD459